MNVFINNIKTFIKDLEGIDDISYSDDDDEDSSDLNRSYKSI